MNTFADTPTISSVLGLQAHTPSELIAAIEQGLPFEVFNKLQIRLQLSEEGLSKVLGIPVSTLARRKKLGHLTPEESDRLLRVTRLLSKAELLFVATNVAAAWFTKAVRGLGGKTPLEYARTEVGAREVEALLERLLEGQAV
jgi:putative toxin-antitoxin system antitoxin component (TIGR02293 family)